MCRGSAEDLRIVACGCALAALVAAMMAAAVALAEDEGNQRPRPVRVIPEPPLLPPVYFIPAPPPSQVAPLALPRVFATGGRPHCREFTAEARVAERLQRVSHPACRRPDGTWQPTN